MAVVVALNTINVADTTATITNNKSKRKTNIKIYGVVSLLCSLFQSCRADVDHRC